MLGFDALGKLALGETGGVELVPREGSLAAQEQGADGFAAVIEVVVDGAMAVSEAGEDVAAIAGDIVVSGSFALTEAGDDAAAVSGVIIVDAALAAQEAGDDAAAASGVVLVSGALAVSEAGDDVAALEGAVIVEGSLDVDEEGADVAAFVVDVETAGMAAVEEGEDGADLSGVVIVVGAVAATESTDDVSAVTIEVVSFGSMAVVEDGADQSLIVGEPVVTGTLATTETYGLDTASGTGESLAPAPRDPATGFIYLVEIDAWNTSTEEVETFRFGSRPFTTRPVDSPSNAHYEDRLKLPGDYSRSLFSSGRTGGVADVGVGVIELVNNDGGLDALESYAFDGRRLRIRSIERGETVIARAVTVFDGTMEQAEFTWDKISIRLRDRLAELDSPLQETLYAGTTTSGGLNEAEAGRMISPAGRSRDAMEHRSMCRLSRATALRKFMILALTGCNRSLRCVTVAWC
jgi:hypothetical protein